MNRKPLAYLHGKFLPASQAALSLDDAGFIWGATATERLRTFDHHLFRLQAHLERFRQSCDGGYIPQPLSNEELAGIAHELIAANAKLIEADEELSLLLFATPGIEPNAPTLGMQTSLLPLARYRKLGLEGVALVPMAGCLASGTLDPRIKHRSRLAWWIASKQLALPAEPLFITADPEQFVRETSIANLIVEIDGRIVSPPRSKILNGISLQVVEELCLPFGISFVEREIPLAELLERGGECFLTNTSFSIASVSRIGARAKEVGGPLFRLLSQGFADVCRADQTRTAFPAK